MTETLEIVTFRLKPGSEAGFENEADRRDRQDSVAHVSFFVRVSDLFRPRDNRAARC
ncbi:hypothetical protein ACWGS9_26560 [Bradyrhizobium sp. Arg314]